MKLKVVLSKIFDLCRNYIKYNIYTIEEDLRKFCLKIIIFGLQCFSSFKTQF